MIRSEIGIFDGVEEGVGEVSSGGRSENWCNTFGPTSPFDDVIVKELACEVDGIDGFFGMLLLGEGSVEGETLVDVASIPKSPVNKVGDWTGTLVCSLGENFASTFVLAGFFWSKG